MRMGRTRVLYLQAGTGKPWSRERAKAEISRESDMICPGVVVVSHHLSRSFSKNLVSASDVPMMRPVPQCRGTEMKARTIAVARPYDKLYMLRTQADRGIDRMP